MGISNFKNCAAIVACSAFCVACGDGKDAENIADALKNSINSPFSGVDGFLSGKQISRKNGLKSFLFDASSTNGQFQIQNIALKTQNYSFNLHSAAADAGFEWIENNRFIFTDGSTVSNSILLYNGHEVVGSQLKARLNEKGDIISATGNIPSTLSKSQPNSSDLIVRSLAYSKDEAVKSAAETLGFEVSRFHSEKYAWYVSETELIPVWIAYVSAESDAFGVGPVVPLRVTIDASNGSIIDQMPLAFHATGQAQIYPENKVATSTLQAVGLADLIGDGNKLSSDQINVFNCDSKEASATLCTATASGPDYSDIKFTDKAYDEVMAYYSITRTIAWHEAMIAAPGLAPNKSAIDWGLKKQTLGLAADRKLNVYVRTIMKTDKGITVDNAQYMPGGLTGSDNPVIVAGTGGEPGVIEVKNLKYIGKDSDVYMHEFGHHVIFRNLTDIKNESQTLALHEGFADYFVYSITGNNKLGESITLSGLPLRAGNQSGPYKNYSSSPAHKQGEYWSSILWELRTKLGKSSTGAMRADKILWDSIDLMRHDADFYNAIAQIAKAAEAYASANNDNAVELKNIIYNVFFDRGFIAKPDGSGNLPASLVGGSSSESDGTTTTTNSAVTTKTKSTGSSSDESWCGVVAGSGKSFNFGNLLLLLIPFMFPVGGLVTERVKRNKRNKL